MGTFGLSAGQDELSIRKHTERTADELQIMEAFCILETANNSADSIVGSLPFYSPQYTEHDELHTAFHLDTAVRLTYSKI